MYTVCCDDLYFSNARFEPFLNKAVLTFTVIFCLYNKKKKRTLRTSEI